MFWVYLYLVYQHSEVIEVTAQLVCVRKVRHKCYHISDNAGQGILLKQPTLATLFWTGP